MMGLLYWVEKIYKKIKNFFFPSKRDKDRFIY